MDPVDPDLQLLEEEIVEDGPVIEAVATIEIPKKGKVFEDDGTCGIVVIRPCISQGKKLRGLPPIYTPAMLAENAAVFTSWPMFMDHLTEEMVEALRKRSRSIRELGGRIVRSFYDPEFVTEEDEERGFRRGAVRARALPQPPIRAMLEADPEILRTSINAWPKSAKPGSAPWAPKTRGMLIEGIRSKPQGSVDWVIRDGAGGRVLQEDLDLAVSVLESYYDAPRASEDDDMKLSDITTADQLRQLLESENPDLLAAFTGGTPTPPTPTPPAPGVTQEARSFTLEDVRGIVTEALAEQEQKLTATFETKLEEHDDDVEERAQELFRERDESKILERHAHTLIDAAGLSPRWTADLKARYSVFPSGPSAALQVEPVTEGDDPKDSKAVLTERVNEDLKHAAALIRESGGKARVKGLGATTPDEGGSSAVKEGETAAWRDFLAENGGLEADPEKREAQLREMIEEGVVS